jgi:hypothetical protein
MKTVFSIRRFIRHFRQYSLFRHRKRSFGFRRMEKKIPSALEYSNAYAKAYKVTTRVLRSSFFCHTQNEKNHIVSKVNFRRQVFSDDAF